MTEARPADVVIVLGARIGRDGAPSPALRRRLERGLDLFRQGKAGMLLLSGGSNDGGPTEAAVMRRLARAAGVPAARIVIEPASRSTYENARNAAALMRAHGWRSAIVVTDRLHLPRALLAFRGSGVAVRGDGVAGARTGSMLAQLPHEAAGLIWYALRLLWLRLRS